jgi:multiple sugar transport system substrate-binding protein
METKLMTRKLSILFLLAFALLMLSMTAHAQTEIVVWSTGSEDEALVLQAAADAYAAANSGVTITVTAVDWSNAHAQMLAAATSGTGPDIITGGLSWGIEFGELGGMVDLTASYPDDVAAIAEQSNAGIWAATVPPTGEVYVVPFDLTLFMMYYNSAVLEELGIEVPTTWEELTAAIEVIRAANDGEGGFQMGWGNIGWIPFQDFLYQAGGTWYNEDCTAATVNSEEGVVALEFYASLYTEYGSPTVEGDIVAGLQSGLYPIAAQGSWIAGGIERTYPELAGSWGITVQPAGPAGNNSAFIGGRGIGIMSFSPNADASWDFIKYLWTPEAVDLIITAAADRGLYWIPPLAEFNGSPLASDEINAAVQAQLDQAQGPPNCPGWEQANSAVTTALQSVVLEGADPQEALDEAADAMDAELE